jgi:hypothetical protein
MLRPKCVERFLHTSHTDPRCEEPLRSATPLQAIDDHPLVAHPDNSVSNQQARESARSSPDRSVLEAWL